MFDQYGNYIPDQFGGQMVQAPQMTPDMGAAMNPQMMQRGQAMQQAQAAQNTAPVLAPQRQSIQPMGMQSSGGMGYQMPQSSAGEGALSGLADALRQGAGLSDEKKKKLQGLSMGDRWNNTTDALSKFGDKFSSLFGD